MLPWLFWAGMYCNSKLRLRSSKFVVGAITVCHHFALWNTSLPHVVYSKAELLRSRNCWMCCFLATHGNTYWQVRAHQPFIMTSAQRGCRSPTCPSRQICTIDNEYQWIVLINAAKFIQGPNQTDNEKHFALHACDWWGSSRRSNFSRSLQKLDVSMWKHVNSDVKTIAVLFEVVTLDTPVPCS